MSPYAAAAIPRFKCILSLFMMETQSARLEAALALQIAAVSGVTCQ